MTLDPLFPPGPHAPSVTVVRRHIPPGVRHRAAVVAAVAAKPKPPKEPMPVIPEEDLVEVVTVLRRRAPHCFLCRLIVKNMVEGEMQAEMANGDEVFPVRGQIHHALNELAMSRHPDWVAAQKAVGTY